MPASPRGRALALLGAFALVTAGCGASATPTPAPTPTPTLAPTPAPTATPFDVGAAFLARLQATTTGRFAMTGTATLGAFSAALTGSMELSGADMATSMTFDLSGTQQVQDSVRIGTKRWARQAPGPWVLSPRAADPARSLSAFIAGLTTVEDQGLETKDARQLHHLVPPASATLTPDALGLDPSIKDATLAVDFWAQDDGTPAIMTLGVTWTEGTGAAAVPVDISMDLDLTGAGAAVSIAAPEAAWTGFTSTRYSYSMAFDQGWSVTEADTEDQYLMGETPYVYVAPKNAPGYTLDQFHAELLDHYATQDIVAKPDADEAYAIDGNAARILTYHFKTDSGRKLLLVDAITVHGDRVWEVYLLQPATGETEARTYFDTMLSTFSFED